MPAEESNGVLLRSVLTRIAERLEDIYGEAATNIGGKCGTCYHYGGVGVGRLGFCLVQLRLAQRLVGLPLFWATA